MPLLLRHVPTNAVAYLALFVALGGTSYAAVKLPRNSVGTKQIRAKAVTLAKIAPKAPRSLRGATGPAGAAGPARPAGTAGAAGAPGDPGPLGPPGPTASGFARQADGQKHAPIGFDARTTFVETGAEAGPHRSGPIQVAVPSTLLRVPAIRRGGHAAGDQPQVLRGRPRVDPRLSGPVARGGGARRAGQIRRAGPLLNLTAIVAGR